MEIDTNERCPYCGRPFEREQLRTMNGAVNGERGTPLAEHIKNRHIDRESMIVIPCPRLANDNFEVKV